MSGHRDMKQEIEVTEGEGHLEFDSAEYRAIEKKAYRKIDLWLVGFYSLVYVFRVVDSSGYTNAAILNINSDRNIKIELNLGANAWAWTVSIFSYSYLIFEPTNTILLKRFRPSRWLFVLILTWGICACCTAAVQNFTGMMFARFAVGVAEAGFYPSVLFHLSFWYKPTELPWRIALFYSAGQLSSALCGLLAYGISFMNGIAGLSGWRWLFLLEGLPPVLLSFVALFGLPDYPETARMLTPDERDLVVRRLANIKVHGQDRNWSWRDVGDLFKQSTVYTFATYWICHGIGGFGIAYALPTVVYDLGFTTSAKAQLMNIPPYVSCFLFLNTMGYLLHRKWIRPWTAAVSIESTIIICYIILVTVNHSVVRYLAIIVAVSCAGSAYPVIWPERIRALDGTVAAGVGIGFTNAMAQFSGIVGPHVYSTVFGPNYVTSYIICLSFLVVAIIAIILSWWLVIRKDRRAALNVENTHGEIEGAKDVIIPPLGPITVPTEF